MEINGLRQLIERPEELTEMLKRFISDANTVEVRRLGAQAYPAEHYNQAYDLLSELEPGAIELKELISPDLPEAMGFSSAIRALPITQPVIIKELESVIFKSYIKQVMLLGHEELDFTVSTKLRGEPIRLVYEEGTYVHAATIARRGLGTDITEQVRVTLEGVGLDKVDNTSAFMEVRGVLVLPEAERSEAQAQLQQGYDMSIRDILTSGNTNVMTHLDFIAEAVVITNQHQPGYTTKEGEYEFLSDLGFETPYYWTLLDVLVSALASVMEGALQDIVETLSEVEYEYELDGLLLTLNGTKHVEKLLEQEIQSDQVLLKVGPWTQMTYSGKLQYVRYKREGECLEPILVISTHDDTALFEYEGTQYNYTELVEAVGVKVISNVEDYIINKDSLAVITNEGHKVNEVPAYSIANIIKYELEPGSTINFVHTELAGPHTVFDEEAIYFKV